MILMTADNTILSNGSHLLSKAYDNNQNSITDAVDDGSTPSDFDILRSLSVSLFSWAS